MSRIYSSDDLDHLRNHIMFPVEKSFVLNTIARSNEAMHTGRKYRQSMLNLLDEKSLDKIAQEHAFGKDLLYSD